MCNTISKQTEQLSRKLDEKNDILCKFMESNVSKNFANNFLQKDIVSESSRQPRDVSKNIGGSVLNSPPQCFECNTPIGHAEPEASGSTSSVRIEIAVVSNLNLFNHGII